MSMSDDEADAIVRTGYEAGHLKRSRRTGWWVAGISDPESVAEHSWRTAVLAWFIAQAEGANPERTVTIATFHDMGETRTGDIEYVGRRYVTVTPDEEIARDQAAALPPAMASAFVGIITEMEDGKTIEARCARDADKLECLLQAREYQRQGHADVKEWIDNMHAAVRTPTGRLLADAALRTDPADWWRQVTNPNVVLGEIRRAV